MNLSKRNEHARRKFLAYFSGAGLTTTLFPGVLWARLQESGAEEPEHRHDEGNRGSCRA